jgi:hypothetical protein
MVSMSSWASLAFADDLHRGPRTSAATRAETPPASRVGPKAGYDYPVSEKLGIYLSPNLLLGFGHA